MSGIFPKFFPSPFVQYDPAGNHPALPAGHPFSIVLFGEYWSATTYRNPTFAWEIFFYSGQVGANSKISVTLFAWCVRGGHGLYPDRVKIAQEKVPDLYFQDTAVEVFNFYNIFIICLCTGCE